MKALPVVWQRSRAMPRLFGPRRRTWAWLARVISGGAGGDLNSAANPAVARFELVYLPEFLVTVTTIRSRRPRMGWLVVNSTTESLLILGASEPAWESIGHEQLVGSAGDREGAAQVVRRHLRRTRTACGYWRIQPLAHPYWAYYISRRGDRLDVRLLDAVTGRPCATRFKIAFLQALSDQARSQSTPPAETRETSPHP